MSIPLRNIIKCLFLSRVWVRLSLLGSTILLGILYKLCHLKVHSNQLCRPLELLRLKGKNIQLDMLNKLLTQKLSIVKKKSHHKQLELQK
jgi:hypothetical protein